MHLRTSKWRSGTWESARDAQTWGAPQEGRLAGVRPATACCSSTISGLTSSRPKRISPSTIDLFHGAATNLLEAEATSAPFADNARIWPNEVYPERLRFRELEELHDIDVNLQAQPAGIVEATRTPRSQAGAPSLRRASQSPSHRSTSGLSRRRRLTRGCVFTRHLRPHRRGPQ